MKDRRTPTLLRRTSLCVAMALTAPVTAHAIRLDYTVGASLLHSDNIGLSETNDVRDTVLSPELSFTAEQDSSRLQLRVEGDLQYPYYFKDTFESQLQGQMYGRANWSILPERIDFEVTDSLSRQTVNVLESFVPSNLQQVNVLSLGPTFRARFGDVTRGQVDLRYVDTYAEESSDFTGAQYTLSSQLERTLTNNDTLSLNLDGLQTSYDADGALYDYARYDAFLDYQRQLASLHLFVEAGYSWLRPDNYDGDSSSPLYRAGLEWQVAPRTRLSASYNLEYSDAAQYLIRWRQPQDGLPTDPIDPTLPIGSQPFRQRRLMLAYEYRSERFSAQVAPYLDRLRYEFAPTENQDIKSLSLRADYALSPLTTVSFAGVYQDRDLENNLRNDKQTVVSLALEHRLSRNWSAGARYQRAERDSSGFTQGYTENSLMVRVTYRR